MKTLAAYFALFAALLALVPPLAAADLWIGTWVQKNQPITMIIEPYGAGGQKITYRVKMADKETVMVVESALDGTDAPVKVDDKPSRQTSAWKRLDDRHISAVGKVNGQTFEISKGEVSADGKTLTVQKEYPSDAQGNPVKITEIWDRK
jgi:hypothetical protein